MDRKLTSIRFNAHISCILILCLFIFTNKNVQAGTPDLLSVKEQLAGINKYWACHKYDGKESEDRVNTMSEVELIQLHLRLVEESLRNNCPDDLTDDQKFKREECLDILHQYWKKGLFPKNTHHDISTPYFIDDVGTACAVGQLIISTGYGDLAQKISKENNYAYIEDLHYAELISWAEQFGFEVDELIWIQPEYGCFYPSCDDNTLRNVSCYGGSDGCIGIPWFQLWSHGIDVVIWPMPFYYLDSVEWRRLYYICDLYAGTYKLQAYDWQDSLLEFFYTITQPDPIVLELSAGSGDGGCDGSASVNVTGGVPPYTYEWSHQKESGNSINGLCPGVYYVSVKDANGCVQFDSIKVDFASGTSGVFTNELFVYPNPVQNRLSFGIDMQVHEKLDVVIYNTTGRSVYSTKVNKQYSEVDVSSFQDGIYFLRIFNGVSVVQKKFIKTTSF